MSWMLDIGTQMLDIGTRMSDIGTRMYRYPDVGYHIIRPISILDIVYYDIVAPVSFCLKRRSIG